MRTKIKSVLFILVAIVVSGLVAHLHSYLNSEERFLNNFECQNNSENGNISYGDYLISMEIVNEYYLNQGYPETDLWDKNEEIKEHLDCKNSIYRHKNVNSYDMEITESFSQDEACSDITYDEFGNINGGQAKFEGFYVTKIIPAWFDDSYFEAAPHWKEELTCDAFAVVRGCDEYFDNFPSQLSTSEGYPVIDLPDVSNISKSEGFDESVKSSSVDNTVSIKFNNKPLPYSDMYFGTCLTGREAYIVD
jgi:hypothetical protein